MTEFKCDVRCHGNVLYGKNKAGLDVLLRQNNCYWRSDRRMTNVVS